MVIHLHYNTVILGKIHVPVLYTFLVCVCVGGANLSDLKQYPRILATLKKTGSWGGVTVELLFPTQPSIE